MVQAGGAARSGAGRRDRPGAPEQARRRARAGLTDWSHAALVDRRGVPRPCPGGGARGAPRGRRHVVRRRRRRARAAPAGPRPGRADGVRAGRGRAPRRHPARAARMGGPLAVRVGNTEWPKWETVMAPDPVAAEELEGLARNAPLTRPRPGHADLVGMQKYGFDDARPVLERASARETAARVALGDGRQVRCCARRTASRCSATSCRSAPPRSAPDVPLPRPADLPVDRRQPGAGASTPTAGDRLVGGGRRGQEGGRHARRRRRGAGVRRAAGAGQLRARRPPHRRAGWPRR